MPMKLQKLFLAACGVVLISASMTSCASDEPKRRERQPPPVADSTMPWNRPTKWEGTGRYGQMMPMSR